MKCPHCEKEIDGYRGKFSIETTSVVLDMFYEQKKSIYSIVKHLASLNVKTNKMTVKKVTESYVSTWKDYLTRHAQPVAQEA